MATSAALLLCVRWTPTRWISAITHHQSPVAQGDRLIDIMRHQQNAGLLAPAFRASSSGSPEQCADQIRTLLAMGFRGVSCNLAPVIRASNYVGLRETLEGAAEMLALLR